MKITIETTLIFLQVEDEPKLRNDNYTARGLPELPVCLKSAVDEAIKLHNEVSKSITNKP